MNTKLLEQLLEFTKKYESKITNLNVKNPDEQINEYHKKMIDRNEAIFKIDGDKLLGYCEYWLLNFEQFGRSICENYNPHDEIHDGKLCYLANVCIPDDSDNKTRDGLKLELFERVLLKCDYFVGNALRKRHHPISVFKITDSMRKKYLAKEAV